MNLWTFVLLGFLAQASNATLEWSNGKISDIMKKQFSKALYGLNNFQFPGVSAFGLPTNKPEITNILPGAITCEHTGDGTWSFSLSADVTVGSGNVGIHALNLNVQANGQIKLGLQNVNINAEMVPGSLSIKIKLNAPIVSISISVSLLNTYIESCRSHFQTALQQTCNSAMTSLNNQFEGMTNHFTYGKRDCKFQVREIHHLPDSSACDMDLVMDTAQGPEIWNLGSGPAITSILHPGSSLAWSVSSDFLAHWMNNNPISYKKHLSKSECDAYRIYPNVPDGINIAITQTEPFSCKTTVDRFEVSLSASVQFTDNTNGPITDFDIKISIDVTAKQSKTSIWFDLSVMLADVIDPISGNNPTPEEKFVIDVSVNGAFEALECQMQDPMPIPWLDPTPEMPTQTYYDNGGCIISG